jgi:hypothetical protein
MTKQPQPTTPMTRDDAARIQSHNDQTGADPDFARRAQSAADRRPPAPQPEVASPKQPGRR